MTISDLIEYLESLKESEGDIEIEHMEYFDGNIDILTCREVCEYLH